MSSKSCVRCSTVFAGIYTLVQSLAWAVGAIYLVSVFTCQLDSPFKDETQSNTTSYLLFLSYFRGTCRVSLINNHSTAFETPSAKRTFLFLMVYSILSSIWLPTAVLLLVASLKKIRGSYTKYFYLPWMLITTIVCIVDVVATVEYCIDIGKTLTINDYIRFTEAPQPLINIGGAEGITMLPALIMSIVSARGVVLWIINVTLLAFSIQGLCHYSRLKHEPKKSLKQKEANTDEMDRSKRMWMNQIPLEDRSNKLGNGGAINPGFIEDNHQQRAPQGRTGEVNRGFLSDEPLTVEPSRIEVSMTDQPPKAQKGVTYGVTRVVEVATEPQERELEPANGGPSNAHVEGKLNRRVYDVFGNPTDASLTPPYRNKLNQPKQEVSGYQKPWSYTMPPVDLLRVKPDVSDTEKPPIPVADYSVLRSPKKSQQFTQMDVIGEPNAYKYNQTATTKVQ